MTNVQPHSIYDKSINEGAYSSAWSQCQPINGIGDLSMQRLELNSVCSQNNKSGVTEKHEKGIIMEDTNIVLQERTESFGKKKTPMCLVNELARHHKVQPQYRLTEESGPAHQKTFVVCLKLGEEEYTASGQSIKKAQHAAAQLALQNTQFKIPEPKTKTKFPTNAGAGVAGEKPITPTVELNALAMKLNLPPLYTNLPPIPSPNIYEPIGYQNNGTCNEFSPLCKGDFRLNQVENGRFLNADFQRPFRSPQRFLHNSNQRFFFNRFQQTPMTHRVTLSVGEICVTGEGTSPQAARHHAAQQAIEKLRNETLTCKAQLDEAAVITDADTDSDLKSPVSLAHELALKLNQTVEFTVLNESGPPHLRNFVVQCKLGEVTTQGEGNCKKLAKKKAAEIMLEELKKVHPTGIPRPVEGSAIGQQRTRVKNKPTIVRKKPRNLVKDVTSASNGSLGTKPQDPISQLVQLQQARKEKEPVFTVVSEKGLPRQSPEFVVEVVVGSITATGVGVKKKDAKRAAALKALEVLGASIKSSLSESEPESLETLTSPPTAPSSNGRQMVPGLLFIGSNQDIKLDVSLPINASTPSGIKETSQITHPPKTSGGLRPEIRLRYLAQVLEYEVEFSDFPKGKKGDFVSLVTLNTIPPQVSHGLGSTLEEAHDNAASNMLKLIAEGALDDMVSTNKENTDQGNDVTQ